MTHEGCWRCSKCCLIGAHLRNVATCCRSIPECLIVACHSSLQISPRHRTFCPANLRVHIILSSLLVRPNRLHVRSNLANLVPGLTYDRLIGKNYLQAWVHKYSTDTLISVTCARWWTVKGLPWLPPPCVWMCTSDTILSGI